MVGHYSLRRGIGALRSGALGHDLGEALDPAWAFAGTNYRSGPHEARREHADHRGSDRGEALDRAGRPPWWAWLLDGAATTCSGRGVCDGSGGRQRADGDGRSRVGQTADRSLAQLYQIQISLM